MSMAAYPIVQGDAVSAEDVDSSSDTLAVPTVGGINARVVRVAVTQNTFVLPVQTGGTVSNTTGHLVTSGEPLYLLVAGYPLVAHIRDTADGRITVSAVT